MLISFLTDLDIQLISKVLENIIQYVLKIIKEGFMGYVYDIYKYIIHLSISTLLDVIKRLKCKMHKHRIFAWTIKSA